MSRQQRTARVLALDIPVALLIGVVTLAAAHVQGGFDPRPNGPAGPDGRSGPPWADGGPEVSPLHPAAYPCIAVLVGSLVMRRFYPRWAFAAAMAALTVFLLLGETSGLIGLGPMVLTYTVAALLPLRQWVPLAALVVPVVLAAFADRPYFGLLAPDTAAALVMTLIPLLIPAAVGVIVRSRRENARREHDQEVHRSVYEERLRIAREVHDLVGHSLSVINMQAGVALHVLAKRPEQAEPALEAIRHTSKDALEELRGTLAVFRTPEGGAKAGHGHGGEAEDSAEPVAAGAPREPVPGLERLGELTAGIESAGRSVEARVAGRRVPLPAAVDHAAYRIIQESLTNVVRHGGGCGATVDIDYTREELTVEITDSGPARAGAGHEEGGGIAGMRERARAVGGRLWAGPRAEGGFRVRAELPLGDR